MNERGTHMVHVRIGTNGVNIDSELNYANTTRPLERGTDTFSSVGDAKKKLESLRKFYQRFEKGYEALFFGELGLLLVSLGKGFEHLANGADSGGDLLRMLGVIGIGIVTVAADVTAENNKVKASNKLSAVEEAEKAGALHFRHTYPFV